MSSKKLLSLIVLGGICGLAISLSFAQPGKYSNPVRYHDDDKIEQMEAIINQDIKSNGEWFKIRPEIQENFLESGINSTEEILNQQQILLSQSSAGDWVSLGPEGGLIKTLAMDPNDHNVIYAQTYGYPTRIFKSINGGSSWEILSEIMTSYAYTMTIDPNNSQILYVVDNRYLFKSIDGGLNWDRYHITTTEYPYLEEIVVCPTNSNIVYAAGDYYANSRYIMAVYKSTDGGLNWVRYDVLPSSYQRCYCYCLAVNPQNYNELYIGGYYYDGTSYFTALYKSLDGGINWKSSNNGISGYVYALAVAPDSSNKVYASTYSGIYRSRDSGSTWTKNNGYARSYELAIDPVHTNIIYAGYRDRVYKSTDSGINWKLYNNGLTGYCYSLLVDHINSNIVFYATESGVFKSENGGIDWFESNKNLIAARIPAMAIAPTDQKTLYVEVDDIAVFKSNDYGDHWTRLPSFLACGNIGALAVDPASPDIAYALEGSG